MFIMAKGGNRKLIYSNEGLAHDTDTCVYEDKLSKAVLIRISLQLLTQPEVIKIIQGVAKKKIPLEIFVQNGYDRQITRQITFFFLYYQYYKEQACKILNRTSND